jgi:hypothetical protein
MVKPSLWDGRSAAGHKRLIHTRFGRQARDLAAGSHESKQQNRQRDDVVGGFYEQPLTRVIPRALAVGRGCADQTESASA